MRTFKRKFSVAFVIVFGVMFMMFLSPTTSVLAAENGSFQHNHAVTIAVAPDTIYYEESRTFSSPGPSSIKVETYKHGRWYSGTITKITEQVDPSGPFYITRYGGTLTLK